MHDPQLWRDLDEIFQRQAVRIERNTEGFVRRARIRRTERQAETLRAADAMLHTGHGHATGREKPSLSYYDNRRTAF